MATASMSDNACYRELPLPRKIGSNAAVINTPGGKQMKPRATDPLETYLKEVATVQPLAKHEENALFEQASVGNESATRKLIESKLALVVAIAERYSSSGLPMLHLLQEGNCGLMKAVDTYAKKPTGDFTAHASALIDAAIRQAIAEHDTDQDSPSNC